MNIPPSSSARSVLVSGGSSGIGAAIARAFAAQGCQVVATGVSEAEVAAAQQQPGQAGIGHRVLDVRDGAV